MVTKNKKQDEKKQKVKVGELELNKETVKDLSADEQKQIKAGYGPSVRPAPGDPGKTICVKQCAQTLDCFTTARPRCPQ